MLTGAPILGPGQWYCAFAHEASIDRTPGASSTACNSSSIGSYNLLLGPHLPLAELVRTWFALSWSYGAVHDDNFDISVQWRCEDSDLDMREIGTPPPSSSKLMLRYSILVLQQCMPHARWLPEAHLRKLESLVHWAFILDSLAECVDFPSEPVPV